MSFWKDIKTAVALVGEIRSAREDGVMLEARRVWRVPALKPTAYWPHTMEFCLVCNREIPARCCAPAVRCSVSMC